MLLPHILGSALVVVRSIPTIAYESLRFWSSGMLSRNFVTLALLTFVLISVILIPLWMSRHFVPISFFANSQDFQIINAIAYKNLGAENMLDRFKIDNCISTTVIPSYAPLLGPARNLVWGGFYGVCIDLICLTNGLSI
jgi:hypothetical protein